MAVVGTTQSTFLGRIFFGFDDEESDAIAWDVDCRPSDACWLALKTGAPVLVHRAVWESNAEPLSEMGYVVDAATGFETGGSKEREAGGMFSAVSDGPGTQQLDVAALTTTVLRSDPEPVKLLKLQMRVALSEEDYATAARIRDCAVMRMHVAMKMATRVRIGVHDEFKIAFLFLDLFLGRHRSAFIAGV